MPHQPAPRLFLVRHGDTAWSDSGQHTGRTDVPLTPRGESRGRALAGRLAGLSFGPVFTSPLQRARRTAELAGFGDRAEVDADLVEWDYGDYEGLTSPQIHERDSTWNLFTGGSPKGESPAAAVARANRFLAKFAGSEVDVLAFSSGHFIRTLAAAWLGLPPAAARHFYTATASINVLGYEHGRADRVIRLWNDTGPDTAG